MELQHAEKLYENGRVEILEDYSGRFMFGEKTTAVTFNSESDLTKAMLRAVASFTDDEAEEQEQFIRAMCKLRRDDFGRGSMAY